MANEKTSARTSTSKRTPLFIVFSVGNRSIAPWKPIAVRSHPVGTLWTQKLAYKIIELVESLQGSLTIRMRLFVLYFQRIARRCIIHKFNRNTRRESTRKTHRVFATIEMRRVINNRRGFIYSLINLRTTFSRGTLNTI